MLQVKRAGHSTLTTPDIGRAVDYFTRIVGLNLVVRDKDAFLRCSRDHHTVNFLRDAKTAIHHIAFEVRDWSDIKRASDLLAKNNIKFTWGPLRHIIGHNIAIYHKNPDGVVIEFFCEMDQMHDEELGFFEPRPWHQDRPQRPKVWGDDTPSNWWGPMSHSPNRTHTEEASRSVLSKK
jgi:catechol 2,3-dioxygenase-like lactoylglutathione lyase family enzyme